MVSVAIKQETEECQRPSSKGTAIRNTGTSSTVKRGRNPKPKKETPPAKRRVRTGCLTCRRKHKKCDENRPKCDFCTSKGLECIWPEEVKKNVFVNNSFKDFCFTPKPGRANSTGATVCGRPQKSSFSLSGDNGESLSSLEYHLGSDLNKTRNSLDYSELLSPSELQIDPSSPYKRRKKALSESLTGVSFVNSAFDGYSRKSEYPDGGLGISYPLLEATGSDSPLSGLFSTFQEPQSATVAAAATTTAPLLRTPSFTTGAGYDYLGATGLESTGVKNTSSASSISSEMSLGKKEADFEHRYSFADITSGLHKKRTVDSSLKDSSYVFGSTALQHYDLPNTLRDFMCLVAATKDTTSGSRLPNNETIFEFFADKSTMEVPQIEEEEMMLLMDTYIDEVASILDKSDDNEPNVFVTEIPAMAESFPALQYAVLALSSRHLEKVNSLYSGDKTLQLYNYALQQLSLSLNTSKDWLSVVSACVLLCYFEIMSTEAQSWRERLSTCGTMFKACGINAASESVLGRGLFWSFVSMDIGCCCIGEGSTIIGVNEWFGSGEEEEVDNTASLSEFHSILLLSAKVFKLLSSNDEKIDFDLCWKELWESLSTWELNRSNSMRSCYCYKRSDSFPEVLFSNPAAISANQLFHMCCIVMLQNKPRLFKIAREEERNAEQVVGIVTTSLFQSAVVESESSDVGSSASSAEPPSTISSSKSPGSSNMISKSQIWHAKQIIGTNLCNLKTENRRNLGCQILSLQCIWIAGKLISSSHEHSTILRLLKDIESWCGLSMSWRGKELVEFWKTEC